jgi:hypothetical protein
MMDNLADGRWSDKQISALAKVSSVELGISELCDFELLKFDENDQPIPINEGRGREWTYGSSVCAFDT